MPCAKHSPVPQTFNVNLAQFTVGLAWHYKEFAKDQPPQERGQYAFAEEEARARKAGLWSEPDPVPPWEWRHGPKGGPVKKSKSGICHTPDSPSYQSVKNFTAFPTVEACLASSGRLPKQPG